MREAANGGDRRIGGREGEAGLERSGGSTTQSG